MRIQPVILRCPAKAESVTGILDVILQILAAIEVVYSLFASLFGNAR